MPLNPFGRVNHNTMLITLKARKAWVILVHSAVALRSVRNGHSRALSSEQRCKTKIVSHHDFNVYDDGPSVDLIKINATKTSAVKLTIFHMQNVILLSHSAKDL